MNVRRMAMYHLGERRSDLLDHAVDKILLLRVAAHIGERQRQSDSRAGGPFGCSCPPSGDRQGHGEGP
jgi:hypothetical protein